VILLNCDMGESFGIWRLGDDQRIMPSIHIANVACGFHASDFNHMRTTVQLAKKHDVKSERIHRCLTVRALGGAR
jgi:5-oxoprolinase (ATP-hydrolysing) subunit A